VFPLIQNVSVQSKLAVDPDLDSRNVIEALTVTLPHLTESLSQMRANGGGALAARKNQPATDETRQQLSGLMNVAAFQADTLTQQLEVAMNKNSRFESDLRPILTRANTSRGVFFDNTRDNILNAQALAPGGADIYFLLGGSAIDLSNQLLTSAQQTLNAEFQDRADAARSDFAMQGTAAGIGIILALGLALFMSASITRPMTHLAEVADRMSLGELDVDIDVEGKNEIGQLAESLRRMQASLRSAIERLRQRRAA
jgi:HAMP domain-containing protein